ncbi:hypothetical protein GCM10010361_12680 [Streptomyces olivaceiscleroticus]|uniref:Uncharacterized protein n=1 Tax=Streptomyces olivaceiscleroticus TaxID=68245 RepID=A0ABN0ZK51_9ACTN
MLCTDPESEQFRSPYPPSWGGSRERARLLAAGDAILDLLPALQAAPYGQQDIAVVFDRLNFGNRAIADYFHAEDPRTMLVAFALAHPQSRPLATCVSDEPGGPMHPVQTGVVHTFKLAVEDGPVPVLAALLARHLGPDLVSGETWG